MENENDFKNFDDLVFENRNKQYGAYAIRKSYNDNMNKAVIVAVLSCGLVITLSAFMSEETHLAKDTKPQDTIVLKDQPLIIIDPPPASSPSIRSVSNNVAPMVTTDPVLDTPPEETNTINSPGETSGDAVLAQTDGIATEGPPVAAVVPVTAPPVVDIASVMPEYDGGRSKMISFIERKFHYPPIARRMNIEGVVYISFVVDAEGNVINVKVAKGISKECDEEAKRIVEAMPKWLAGRQGDIPVAVRQYLPIKFTLNFN